ncbi:MAG: aldehyde dehydrogenase family protein [Deltaproteobacteria bacterium]|nr:aldehyde dehydrogenase family protein [Deltaproteobacteria bacterium]
MTKTATFDVRSPFDGSLLKTYSYISEEEALTKLERAQEKYRDRENWLSAQERIQILKRFAALVEEQADFLAKQAAHEGGKPLSDSFIEIGRAVDGVGVAIGEIGKLTGTEIPMGLTTSSAHRFAHTYREPRGVVLAISAFNHPFNLIIHQVITAVAAGCPVMVKPAANTPMSCVSVVDLLEKAGLPEGWCQLVLTPRDVTEKLVGDNRVSFMTFIGSAKVGWYLRSKLAPGASCALEHGGVAPVIVDATADIADAIPLLTRGGFYHAGQVCVSVQRIYVHSSIVEDFTAQMLSAAGDLVTGDPLDLKTDVGPLIREGEVDRVHSWVQEAIAAGAKLLCGGKKLSSTTYAPTILAGVPDGAKLSTEEVFGPVVCIYSYDDMDDAIAKANAPDAFFQASIFTKHLDTALSVSRKLHGMAVTVNDHTAFRVDWMPFGGHRQSGLGLGGMGHSMHDMTLERMVVFRSSAL